MPTPISVNGRVALMPIAADSSITDWIQAVSALALIVVAVLGFVATIQTITQARNRQAVEIEGYIRVDIGPPGGTSDYQAPEKIRFIKSDEMRVLGNALDADPMISVFYRNLQSHPLGVAHGVLGVVVVEVTADNGDILEVEARHEIAYIEAERVVRIDIVRFPSNWTARGLVGAVTYKNANWDGAQSRHGRWECYYEAGQFRMIPWSAPRNSWRDRIDRAMESLVSVFRASPESREE